MHSRSSRAIGFSLLECLVAIALIAAIGAGVTIGFGDSIQRGRLQALVEEILLLDRQLRTRSVSRNARHMLVIDLDAQSIQATSHGRPAWKKQVDPGRIEIVSMDVPERTASTGVVTILYWEDGSSSTWQVTFAVDGQQRSMLIAGQSGQVFQGLDPVVGDGLFERLRGDAM